MSEIDKLLISVGIDEGSSLDELHRMLKDLESSGGKLKIEIPDIPTKRQIQGIGTRITNLSNKMKPMMEKFPEIKDSIREMLEDEVILRLIQIEESIIKDFGEDEDFKDALDEIKSQLVKEEVNQILTKTQQTIKSVGTLKGQITKLNKKLDVKLLTKIDNFQNYLEDTKMELQSYLDIKIDDISEIGSYASDAARRMDDFVDIIGLSLKELKEEPPEFDEIKNAVRLIGDKVSYIHENISDYGEAMQWIKLLDSDAREAIRKADSNWSEAYDVEKKIFSRLKSIRQTKGVIYDLIRREMETKFVEFKAKLDDNLTRIIHPELSDFLDAVAAVMSGKGEKGLKSIWKAPGVKAMGEHEARSGISGFFRQLVQMMSLRTTKSLSEMSPSQMLHETIGRKIEGMTAFDVRDIGKFLGIDIQKKEGIPQILTKIFDQLHKQNMTIIDLVGGTKKTVDSVDKKISKPNQEENNIKRDEQNKAK